MTMRGRYLVPLIVVALAAGVFAEEHASTADWSPIVYPMQRLPLIFSHAKHLARGATCASCHPSAAGSRSAVDNLIPTETECRVCHAIDRNDATKAATPVAACGRLSSAAGSPDRPGRTAASISRRRRSSSRTRLTVQTPCEGCHTDMRTIDLATTRQLPTMSDVPAPATPTAPTNVTAPTVTSRSSAA